MPISVIKHNNMDILLIDHRGLSSDELYTSIKEANDFLMKERRDFLAVVDFTDTVGSKRVSDYLQSEVTKNVAQYIPRQAIVGMSGIKKMVLRMYNSFTGVQATVHDTVEEALDSITQS